MPAVLEAHPLHANRHRRGRGSRSTTVRLDLTEHPCDRRQLWDAETNAAYAVRLIVDRARKDGELNRHTEDFGLRLMEASLKVKSAPHHRHVIAAAHETVCRAAGRDRFELRVLVALTDFLHTRPQLHHGLLAHDRLPSILDLALEGQSRALRSWVDRALRPAR